MSEYQYYEFQAIDQPLTREEQAQVGRISSRTHPTSTQAVFTYSYGDFRGQPLDVLASYYDAMLYTANWGSRQLAFRLPRALVDPACLAPYSVPYAVATSVRDDHVILDISFHEEEGEGWIEEEGWLSSLVPLRRDLLEGDYRALYLAWLKAALQAVDEDVDPVALEPPVPAGLNELTAPLHDFADFFAIDEDLLTVAAEASAPREPIDEISDWESLISRLSEAERNTFLLRLARGEPHVGPHLMNRLREVSGREMPAPPAAVERRTVAALLDAVEARVREREEQQRRVAEQARLRRFDELARAAPHLWDDVIRLIEEKKVKAYDEAVKLLTELRALAEHQGEMDPFNRRILHIQEQYSNRPALRERMKKVGLLLK